MSNGIIIFMNRLFWLAIAIGGGVLLAQSQVEANRYTSPNYTIDASVGNSFGDNVSSASYRLTGSGGESIIGKGAGGSYLLGQGYVAQLEKGLQLSVSPANVTFPSEIISGSSQEATSQVSVVSDAAGYTISVSQNNDLTSGSNTIGPVSGSIAAPVVWDEGNTKGLGLTVVSSSATPPSSVWSGGSAYAAIPNSASTIYTRTGSTAGAADNIDVRYRIDVTSTQPAGHYTNQVTYTGTITP